MTAKGAVRPFRIAVSETELTDLRRRLEATRWPVAPIDAGWKFGTDRDFMERLVAHWLRDYNWRAVEARLDAFPQFIAQIDGYDIHFLNVKGKGPSPQPLLLIHGWPGSFVEFENVIGPLTDPQAFGGDAADSFDVIVPSIPGYGWSSPPREPITTREVAPLFDRLMTEVLGYPSYFAQGGDWGSLIASWLGVDFPGNAKAIHVNMMGLRPYTGKVARRFRRKESCWLDAARHRLRRESGYQAIQGTKPQTIAVGLNDSPAGLAAWIVEKFHGWSESPEGYRPSPLINSSRT